GRSPRPRSAGTHVALKARCAVVCRSPRDAPRRFGDKRSANPRLSGLHGHRAGASDDFRVAMDQLDRRLTQPRELAWRALPRVARVYVGAVIFIGVVVAETFWPTRIDRPWLFIALLAFGALASTWKVNLPLTL